MPDEDLELVYLTFSTTPSSCITDPELAEWIIGLSGGLTPEQLAERIRPS